MRAAALALGLVLVAGGTDAQTAMGAAEFQALSQNRTLHFSEGGRHFGSEQFFGDRRSLWQFRDGTCVEGVWYEEAGNICFDYPGDPLSPHCWRFVTDAEGGVSATATGPDGLRIDLSGVDRQPLACSGPDIGV